MSAFINDLGFDAESFKLELKLTLSLHIRVLRWQFINLFHRTYWVKYGTVEKFIWNLRDQNSILGSTNVIP